MIRPRYALMLARTKLRSKRGMLIASIIVSSMLFAALIASIIVFQGAHKTAVRFVEKANDNHYLVEVTPNIPQSVRNIYDSGSLTLSVETIRSIRAFEKDYYDAERAKYEAAGVKYNKEVETSALKPSLFVDETVPEEQRFMVNFDSPVTTAFLDKRFEDYAKTATNKFSDLQKVGTQYGAKNYYMQQYTLVSGLPAQRLIQDGKEDFSAENKQDMQILTADKNAIHNGSYSFVDDALLKRYLGEQPTELKGIPVVVTAQEVAKLFGKELGIEAEPENQAQRTQWLASLQEKAIGYVYNVCHRNMIEQQRLEKITRDYAEMKNNEKTEGYQKPSLIYNLPEEPCGDITVTSDTRSATEKKFAEDLENDQKKLGTYMGPEHHKLTYQIVGISYAEPLVFSPTNVTDFIRGLLTGSSSGVLGLTAPIPTQMYQSLPESLKFDTLRGKDPRFASRNDDDFADRIVAFGTIEEARTFINEVGCPDRHNPSACDKQFFTSAYGSNYLLLDELTKSFVLVMSIAFPVVLGLALIIIWFTMSRMMAENRKETAVYRAMGARRGDIVSIYTAYTLLVALYIAITSTVLGIAAAYVAHYFYAPEIATTANSMFGMVQSAPPVNLFDLSSPLLLAVIGFIFVVSLVASIQPLIRNVLRPPVHDMRSE